MPFAVLGDGEERARWPRSRLIAKAEAQAASTRSQGYNRCFVCGRPRAYMRRFALCRICFRERALLGELPGVTKSSW